MNKQHLGNHIKYYPLHHFIFLPLMFILFALAAWKGVTDESNRLVWWLFGLLAFCLLWLAIMLRQHYALGNQNRIVRLEFRLRYFELFGKNSKEVADKLTFRQIAALRFADDQEFRPLLEQTLKENLSATEIKQSIRNWQGDYMRV